MARDAYKSTLKDKYGTTSYKKATKRHAVQQIPESEKFLEQAQDPIHQANVRNALLGLAPPATGPQQTIDVRSGLAGNQGATQDVARAAGGGAQTAASRAAAAVRQQATADISQQYGLPAQEAARKRIAGGLATAATPTFAESLGQELATGAAKGALGGAAFYSKGGIAKGMDLDPEMVKALQSGSGTPA